MIGKELIDLIGEGYSAPEMLFAIVASVLITLAGSSVLSMIKSLVEATVFNSGDIGEQENIQTIVVDVESDASQKPLSAQGRNNIKKYCSRYLARKSTERYVPVQLQPLAALVVCWGAAAIFFYVSLLCSGWPFLSSVLTFLGVLLALCAIIPFALFLTTSDNFPEMWSKGKAIGARMKMRKALKKTGYPNWSYAAGPLTRKTVRMLVESSNRWCLVRADSERGMLGVRLAGSVESAVLPDAEEDVLYLVYSDYGLNSAKRVQELIGGGYRAYNIGMVFDEQALW